MTKRIKTNERDEYKPLISKPIEWFLWTIAWVMIGAAIALLIIRY